MSWAIQQNPPRPSYPKESLKHRFVPFGSLANADEATDAMNVDEPLSPHSHKPKIAKNDEAKAKKRKVEGDGSSRKSKKSHATSA